MGDYINAGFINCQRDGYFVKLSGYFTLLKDIPSSANTKIGNLTSDDTPKVDVYFSLVNANGISYLAYMNTLGEVVICNYTGNTISKNTQLYIVGLEWYYK